MGNLSNSAFGAQLSRLPASPGGSLTLGEWDTAAIASVMARPSAAQLAADRLGALGTAGRHVLDVGPGNFLVITKKPEGDLTGTLRGVLGDAAQVFDISSGYALLTLQGSYAQALLQKGLFVDLDKVLASDGASCSSLVAHIAVTAWRLSHDSFGVAVPRSYAGSFWHWLEAASAADGIRPARAL
ncbi:MAG: sarcosine oxidase subunit gamma family protein [Pseudomonadota bacterium]